MVEKLGDVPVVEACCLLETNFLGGGVLEVPLGKKVVVVRPVPWERLVLQRLVVIAG